MPLPSRWNPMGVGSTPCFEIEVSPTSSSLTYGFTPYWNVGGYCRVLDWGDGTGEKASASGTLFSHTYPAAGTYTIKIKADCYRVVFGYSDIYAPLVSYCSGKNWNALGTLNSGYCMFRGCSNMVDDISELPEYLTDAGYMFYHCEKANLPLSVLPEGIVSASNMFGHCYEADLPIERLPEQLSSATYMFDNCLKSRLPIASLPEGITDGKAMFQKCKAAELNFSSLPSGLKTASAMFFVCSSANLNLTALPSGLTDGLQMFRGCSIAKLNISKLPDGLVNGQGMFQACPEAEINISTLAANAPASGWSNLTNIGTMFHSSTKVTGSRSEFLAKCPNASNVYTFDGTSTTE